MTTPDKSKIHQMPVNHVGNGPNPDQPIAESSFLSGIKQRLLSFIYRGLWNEESDQTQVCSINITFHRVLNHFSNLCFGTICSVLGHLRCLKTFRFYSLKHSIICVLINVVQPSHAFLPSYSS